MKYIYYGIMVAFAALFIILIGTCIYAGMRAHDGRQYERQQPMLVTDQGLYACKYTHVGQTIFSDFKCGRYVLMSPLPEGTTPTMSLPAGTKSIQLD